MSTPRQCRQTRPLAIRLLPLLTVLILALTGPAPRSKAEPGIRDLPGVLELCSEQAKQLLRLAKKPIPPELGVKGRGHATLHQIWIETRATELIELVDLGWRELEARRRATRGEMADPEAPPEGSFASRYVALREKLRDEHAKFDSLPPEIRDRHEAVKAVLDKLP